MKSFKLKSIRVIELAQVMDSIQPKDLASAKDIRLNVGLVNDLNAVNKELATKVADLGVKREEVMKPYRKEYAEKSEGVSEEEKKVVEAEINKKLNAELLEKFSAEQKEIDDMSQTEVEVLLSDEKFAKLKEWISKYGFEKYTDKRILVEIFDVLEVNE